MKAAAILAVRDERGGFESADELESVRGIGKALVEKLRPLVKVTGKPKPSGQGAARVPGKSKAKSAAKAK